MTNKMDYKKLGLKIGLELHQQLNTKKLFCDCSTQMKEKNLIFEIKRKLRPVVGEIGEIDRAALFEFFRDREFVYHGYENEACLVDTDDEPPHDINKEALDIAISIALELGLNIPDELHVMRKNVLDGSAITSFQRTLLIGWGSERFDGVRIKSLNLEEDAAKPENKEKTVYSLSRLGIPLIEVGTYPDIKTPEHCREVAENLGLLFRSFNVKRGIGTIRQDVNISIKGGARIEIKGWQNLKTITKLIENEVSRQVNLLKIKDELKNMKIKEKDFEKAIEVTDVFGFNSFALKLPKFANFISTEICPGKTFYNELIEYGKVYGSSIISNIDCKDSLKNKFEVLREKLKAGEDDLMIVCHGNEPKKAVDAIFERAKYCLTGIPEETRKPNQDCTTSYARPLPGSARMYPETDHPPIRITRSYLNKIKKSLPKTLIEKKRELEKIISKEVANQIIKSKYYHLFEKIVEKNNIGKEKNLVLFVASVFTSTLKDLKRRGVPVEKISENDFMKIFEAVRKNLIPRQSVPNVLTEISKGGNINGVIKKFKALDKDELKKIIFDVVKKNGDRKISVLMGMIMSRVRGKADGEFVMKELKKMMKNA